MILNFHVLARFYMLVRALPEDIGWIHLKSKIFMYRQNFIKP